MLLKVFVRSYCPTIHSGYVPFLALLISPSVELLTVLISSRFQIVLSALFDLFKILDYIRLSSMPHSND